MKREKKYILVMVMIIGIVGLIWINYTGYANKVDDYNEIVSDYNTVAQGYVDCIQTTSVENIDGMPTELTYEKEAEKGFTVYLKNIISFSGFDKVKKDKLALENKTEDLVSSYIIAHQITNSPIEWVIDRLERVEKVTGTQPVTKDYDPLGFLGKEGGYTGCVYFSVSDIKQDEIDGVDIVAKGTDCGGCIEVYENKEDAMIRCEYLAQLDNTLMYSGSYAIIGTMVVRTSYVLSDEQQVELTDEITKVLTQVE